jgi:hypothetical protein
MPGENLTEKQAAEWLNVTLRTLQKWRSQGGGPRFTRYSSRCIRYPIDELKAWRDARTFAHTAEAAHAAR